MLRRTVLLGNFGYWLSCWYYFDTYHSPKYTADAHMETTFPACSGLLQQDCVSFLPPQTAKYDTGVDLSSEFSRFQSDQVWRLWVSKDPVPISHHQMAMSMHTRGQSCFGRKRRMSHYGWAIFYLFMSVEQLWIHLFLTDSGIWQLLTYQ